MKQHRKSSIFKKTCLVLCGTAILQGAIFVVFIVFSRTIPAMKQDANNVLAEHVTFRQKSLESLLKQSISDESLFYNVNQYTNQILSTKGYNEELDKQISDELLNILHSSKGTGVFVIIDKDEMQTPYYPSLYLRDTNPNTIASHNADIFALYGNDTMIETLGFPSDFAWQTSIELDEASDTSMFYFKPLREAQNNKIDAPQTYGYWSHPFQIQEDDHEIITYTMPLIDENQVAYGVIGLEFNCDYLRSLLSYEELNTMQNNAYSLGILQETSIQNLLVSGADYTSLKDTEITLKEAYENSYTFEIDDTNQVAALAQLNLYNKDTPFAEEQWVLMGIVKEQNLFMNVYNIQKTLYISITLSIIAALCAAIFVSYRFSNPILMIGKRLKEGNHNGPLELPEINIEEIDDLSQSIVQLSKDVAYVSSRVSRILHVIGFPIGVFAYNRKRNNVFCTDMVKQLMDFSDEALHTQELSREQFDDEIIEFNDKIIEFQDEAVEDGTKDMNLICIQTKEHPRWLRFHQIEQEDELLVVVHDVTKEISEKQKLEVERDIDTLTNLLNRGAFRRNIEPYLQVPKRIGAMVMWDLDNLKYINDTFGHDAGDKYIRAASTVLSQLDPTNVIVARMAGDEFIAFIHDVKSTVAIRKMIRKVHKDLLDFSLELPDGTSHFIRASCGISWYPKDGTTLEDLLHKADFAMYDAKNTSKGSIHEFSQETFNRDELLYSGKEELYNLIDEMRVRFVYQPIVNAKTGDVYGYEALMRPISEHIKNISDLLRLAKAQARLQQIERLTWLGVLKQYATWVDDLQECKIFINSLPNLSLPTKDIATIEVKYASFLKNIVIEIIESDDLDMDAINIKRNFCETHGTRLAIDDYGSGYNNEALLLKITPHYIKVDMAIIQGVSHDSDRQHFVRNIVQFAHAKGALVIAEGIEKVEDMKICIELGIDLLQGYYLGYPESEIKEVEESKKKQIQQFNKK